MNGSPIRQEILETALSWISKGEIEKYMSIHQHDPNANELWMYFRNVIEWVKFTFPTYRREMKGIEWGGLYDKFKGHMFDTEKLEQEIQTLMMDVHGQVSNLPDHRANGLKFVSRSKTSSCSARFSQLTRR